jgi:hypothetical protein
MRLLFSIPRNSIPGLELDHILHSTSSTIYQRLKSRLSVQEYCFLMQCMVYMVIVLELSMDISSPTTTSSILRTWTWNNQYSGAENHAALCLKDGDELYGSKLIWRQVLVSFNYFAPKSDLDNSAWSSSWSAAGCCSTDTKPNPEMIYP